MTGHDAQLLGLDLENLCHIAAQDETSLGGRMQREASAGFIVDADGSARLHGVDDHAAVDELEPCDVCGFGESGRDLFAVAVVVVERNVPGCLLVKERRARTRGL